MPRPAPDEKGKPKSKMWRRLLDGSADLTLHPGTRHGCDAGYLRLQAKKNAYVRGTYLPFRSARGSPGEVKG